MNTSNEPMQPAENFNSFFNLIRRYPLIMFFTMSILCIWLIDIVMNDLLKMEVYTFLHIGSFGPALSAMLIMTVLNPGRAKAPSHTRIIAFIFFIICAGGLRWISRIWWEHDMSWTVIPGDIILVLLAAYVASSAFASSVGVHKLMRPVLNWKINWVWYTFALLLWPVLTFVSNVIAEFFSIPVPEGPIIPDVPILLAILVTFFWTIFFNGPLAEEPGWRGFALPRLQSRFNPLIASVILGFFWGAFHWSGLLIGYRGDFSWHSLFIVTFGEIGLAIIFTWLYNRVKGKSLLPFILLHASMNSTNDYLPRTALIQYTLLTIIIIVMVFADRMWKRLPINGEEQHC
ncbi:MAG: lysostaphin resistance A-like protein [Chitinophagales bacterium]